MKFEVDRDLVKKLTKIKQKDKKLTKKVEKQLELFRQNHLHPPLRTHKLTGRLGNYWSISIDKSVRMTFILNDDEAYFFDIGTHEEVYKVN